MVNTKALIIEGTTDTRNGNLRQGFHKLFARKLGSGVPQIIMGNGKQQAIKKFVYFRSPTSPNLLIDLDKEGRHKQVVLETNGLTEKTDFVYFMVQEMEAWFLSQPEILKSYYGEELKIPRISPQQIEKPSQILYHKTVSTIKGKYHKVKHAVDLLQMLDADILMNDFEDFKKLILSLKN